MSRWRAVLLTILILAARPAAAATIRVTTTAQHAQSGEGCTITDAILTTQVGTPIGDCTIVDSGQGVVIHVPAGWYVLTDALQHADESWTAFPTITAPVTIEGEGATTIITREPSVQPFRLFRVQSAVEIRHLTLSGGDAGTNCCGSKYRGGAILVDDVFAPSGVSLIARDVTFENNTAGFGGAISDSYNFYVASVSVTVEDSTFRGNHADGGGAIEVPPNGLLTVRRSHFEDNVAANPGGAIYARPNPGGLVIDIADSEFLRNQSGDTGGAISSFDVSLTRVTMRDNTARDRGGAIYNYSGLVTIADSTLAGNRARRGGAVDAMGQLLVTGSTFSANVVTEGDGGGIFLDDRSGASRITNSTLSSNRADRWGGAISMVAGGLTLVNATITGNTTTTGWGGGVMASWWDTPIVRLSNSIVAGNSTGGVPSDLYANARPDWLISLGHNLIGSADGDPGAPGAHPAPGAFVQPGDQAGTTVQLLDPGLLPLANNGGPTFTHALAPTSLALDGGSATPPGTPNDDSACLAVDQRGIHRPGAGTPICDIGAFEHVITFPLTLHVGAGGSVVGLDLPCAGDCASVFDSGTIVQLEALPSAGNSFVGWLGGNCDGPSPLCFVTMNASQIVTAVFQSESAGTTITISTPGGGRITSSPAGIDCPSTCTAGFDAGAAVTLTATPETGNDFFFWRDESGTIVPGAGAVYTLTPTGPTRLATIFGATVRLQTTGDGLGEIVPVGISCTTCDTAVPMQIGSTLTVRAVAAPDSDFKGWAGACSGATGDTCTVTITGPMTLAATFMKKSVLTVINGGGGMVSTSTGSAISCPATCAAGFPLGAAVTLNAYASPGYQFSVWDNCDAPSGTTCVVTMTTARTVTAHFEPLSFDLNVVVIGSGVVTRDPIPHCSISNPTCADAYNAAAVVTLTAQASAGFHFTFWDHCDAITALTTCVVTMTSARTVTAHFEPLLFDLNVVVIGSGVVTRDPVPHCSISNPTCADAYNAAAVVTLTAQASAGFHFTFWDHCDAITALTTCVVTMTSARTVTAHFEPTMFALNVAVIGSGTVTSDPLLCQVSTPSCAYREGTVVTLTAFANRGFRFSHWLGCDSPQGTTCTMFMNGPRSVSVYFTDHRKPPVARITLAAPGAIEATGPLTPVLLVGANSSDPDGGGFETLTFLWSVDSQTGTGVTFTPRLSLGDHIVTLSVTDPDGLTGSTTRTIAIKDRTQPSLTLPTSLTLQIASGLSAALPAGVASATDLVDGNLPVACTPTLLALGPNTVRCDSTDVSGNRAQGAFQVTVISPALTQQAAYLLAVTQQLAGGITSATPAMVNAAQHLVNALANGNEKAVCPRIADYDAATRDAVRRGRISRGTADGLLSLAAAIGTLASCGS